jgi:hypothetical protein
VSDFSRPEYASYIALCRDLKLGHPWQPFDQCINDGYDDIITIPTYITPGEAAFGSAEYAHLTWLPTLSDWLEMLHKAGVFEFSAGIGRDLSHWMSVRQRILSKNVEIRSEYWSGSVSAPTREEAAARLWVAVTKK